MKGGGQEGLAYDDFWMVYFGKLRFTLRYTYIYITYMYMRWCVYIGLYVYILLYDNIVSYHHQPEQQRHFLHMYCHSLLIIV